MIKKTTESRRGYDWNHFALRVWRHIETYTVPQYGDRGEDQISEYTAEDCIKQAKKYLERFGRNSRPGQEKLDLLKAAHYIQCACDKMKDTPAQATSAEFNKERFEANLNEYLGKITDTE